MIENVLRRGALILVAGVFSILTLWAGCSNDGTKLNFTTIKMIRLGDCEGRDLISYPPGTAPFDSIMSWLRKNSDGWHPSQETIACNKLIFFGNGTINVVDSLLISNYRTMDGKNFQKVKVDSKQVIRKFLDSM